MRQFIAASGTIQSRHAGPLYGYPAGCGFFCGGNIMVLPEDRKKSILEALSESLKNARNKEEKKKALVKHLNKKRRRNK